VRFQRDQEQSNRESSARLPMTPMIDVVFLLLIYFLVTATLTPSESQLSAALQAEQTSSGWLADLQPQVVRVELIDGRPGYRIGSRVLTSKEDLTALLANLPTEGGVFIRVANDVPVSAAAAAIQAAKDAGFTKVSYVPASS
jgi:biopolymer transport protein ExbD